MKSLALLGSASIILAVAFPTAAQTTAPKPAPKPAGTAKPAPKPTATAPAKPGVPPGAVASVNGTPITKLEVADRLWREMAPQMTDRLINQEIVVLEAKKRGITATPAEIDTQLNEYKNQFLQMPGRSPKDWDDFVTRYGKTNVQADMKVQVLVKKIGEAESAAAKLTPAEEKQIVDDLVRESDKVHAKHILVGMGEQFGGRTDEDAQKRVAEAQQKLKDGTSWDEAAKAYSDDTSNKDRGGDLGFFTRGRMVKEFEDAAFGLKAGETTPNPVKTAYGYHLINVLEAQNTPPTDAQKQKAIADRLDQKKRTAANPGGWFPTVKQNYKVVNTIPAPTN